MGNIIRIFYFMRNTDDEPEELPAMQVTTTQKPKRYIWSMELFYQ